VNQTKHYNPNLAHVAGVFSTLRVPTFHVQVNLMEFDKPSTSIYCSHKCKLEEDDKVLSFCKEILGYDLPLIYVFLSSFYPLSVVVDYHVLSLFHFRPGFFRYNRRCTRLGFLG